MSEFHVHEDEHVEPALRRVAPTRDRAGILADADRLLARHR